MNTALIAIALLAILFSVIVHEIAHGLVAYRMGDDTAYLSGRLTFDPLKHIDPFMTILLPIITFLSMGFAFGGAKPVPVNPARLRRPRKDMLWIALAGPASNIVLAILLAITVRITHFALPAPGSGSLPYFFKMGLAYMLAINLMLACFNLIPVPPLDGSRVLMGIVDYETAMAIRRIEPYGLFIVIGLVALGIVDYLVYPMLYAYAVLVPRDVLEELLRFVSQAR
jgi:Zn-dependent protease